MHNQARGSTIGANFKADSSTNRVDEEDIPALGKHFEHRPGDERPGCCGGLDEETAAIADDRERGQATDNAPCSNRGARVH